jgi:hypothetical protein
MFFDIFDAALEVADALREIILQQSFDQAFGVSTRDRAEQAHVKWRWER